MMQQNEPFTKPKTEHWYSDFPIMSCLLNVECPKEAGWKIAYIVAEIFGCIVAFVLDIVFCFLLYGILKGCKWLIKECLKVIIQNFLAKVLSISAIVIIGFLIFVIIKSGQWERIYECVCGLF